MRRRCHYAGWLGYRLQFARLAELAVLLSLSPGFTWFTRLPELALVAGLPRHAHVAGFAGLIGVAELAIAMAIEAPLAALPLRPIAALVAVLAILTGGAVAEAVALILPKLLLGSRLVEGGLEIALAGMPVERRLLRAGAVVSLPHVVAGAVVRALMGTATTVNRLAGLLNLLLAVSEDDPVVVLGVLQVILSKNVIAGGLCIAGKLHVFLGDVGRSAAYLHIRAIRLEAARERVLSLAIAGMIIVVVAVAVVVGVDVVAATATPMLLSLPHGLPISELGFSIVRARPPAAGACVVRSFASYLPALSSQ